MTQSDPDKPGQQQASEKRSQDALDSISVAAFDVDARIFRTLWHSVFRTDRVAMHALEGRFSDYLAPIRVFVALFGFQFAVAALFGAPVALTLDAMTSEFSAEQVEAWLLTGSPQPLSAGVIDPVLSRWSAIIMWPVSVASTLPYLIALKLYRPSLSWWGHLQLYLIPANGSFIALIAFLPTYPLFQDQAVLLTLISTSLGMVIYFVLTARILAKFYARTALGIIARLSGLIALLPVTLTIILVLQFLLTAWLLDIEFGLTIENLIQSQEITGVGQ